MHRHHHRHRHHNHHVHCHHHQHHHRHHNHHHHHHHHDHHRQPNQLHIAITFIIVIGSMSSRSSSSSSGGHRHPPNQPQQHHHHFVIPIWNLSCVFVLHAGSGVRAVCTAANHLFDCLRRRLLGAWMFTDMLVYGCVPAARSVAQPPHGRWNMPSTGMASRAALRFLPAQLTLRIRAKPGTLRATLKPKY